MPELLIDLSMRKENSPADVIGRTTTEVRWVVPSQFLVFTRARTAPFSSVHGNNIEKNARLTFRHAPFQRLSFERETSAPCSRGALWVPIPLAGQLRKVLCTIL